MMQNYKVIQAGTDYIVREVKTNLTVNTYDDSELAYETAFQLERGGGFNGNTPSFFASNTSPSASAQVRAIKSGVDISE